MRDGATSARRTGHPRCFLHVPKSGGVSIHEALEIGLGAGSVAPQRYDRSVFCAFEDFDSLHPAIRAQVVTNAAELEALRTFSAVSGHFSLPSLLALAPPDAIATVVREPRSRLLSVYSYWRLTDLSIWRPYVAHEHALKPFGDFLRERSLAPMIDNQLCRLLLYGDRRLPPDGFLAPGDVEAVARDAIARIDQLAFVGVYELTAEVWRGMSSVFGVTLEPRMSNVTANTANELRSSASQLVTAEVLDLLEAHTAADSIVYQHVASRRLGGCQPAKELAAVAFARQLVRLGALLA